MKIYKRGSHSAGIRTQGQKLTNISKMAEFPDKGFGGGKAGGTMDTPDTYLLSHLLLPAHNQTPCRHARELRKSSRARILWDHLLPRGRGFEMGQRRTSAKGLPVRQPRFSNHGPPQLLHSP